jgi:molybdenum cofactor synthesis domain-containing protein
MFHARLATAGLFFFSRNEGAWPGFPGRPIISEYEASGRLYEDSGMTAKKYKAAIVIVSTRGARGEREDLVGPVLEKRLLESGYEVSAAIVVTDDRDAVGGLLARLTDVDSFDLILTSGGTGLSPSDLTPEATLDVADRLIPGLAEAMRAAGRAFTPHADLSRAVAAQRRQSLIINLPGSPKGALENLEIALPALRHALDKIKGDPTDCAR